MQSISILQCHDLILRFDSLTHVLPLPQICDVAVKEYALEESLDRMEAEWVPLAFTLVPYKETGTDVVKIDEDLVSLLDDHLLMAQAMSYSPYRKSFEDRITKCAFDKSM